MRALLHFGLFALALTVVGQANADDGRRGKRRTTVVIAPQTNPRTALRVRAPVRPAPPRYDSRRGRSRSHARTLEARREVYDAKRDHEEIVRIANRWTQATRHHNPHAKRNAERRAHLWIEREIRESSAKPDNGRYVHRLHALRRELVATPGGYVFGRRQHRLDARKANVLGELVELSRRQVHRAEARARNHVHLAFSYR